MYESSMYHLQIFERRADTYNMQLSNEPAEKLAKSLVDTSNGAFDLCVFVAGGERYGHANEVVSLRPIRYRGYGGCH